MIDEIKDVQITPIINIIVNIETTKDNGAHWSCYHQNGKNKFYFDSYGLPPQKEIINKFKSPILANDFIIQDYTSKICGQYCLYVLMRLKNRPTVTGRSPDIQLIKDSDYMKILLELKN